MKKSLIALAALGAFAGSAMAQSSVTLYGIVDLGIVKQNRADSATLPALGGVGVTNKEVNVAQATRSRLGFRGVEDLGGGYQATFGLEHRFLPDTGAQNGGVFWDKAVVGLTTPFGQIMAGRDYMPAFYLQYQQDPWLNQGIAEVGATTYAFALYNATQGLSPRSARINDALYYNIKVDGLSVMTAISMKETNAAKNRFGFNVSYSAGPLFLGLAMDKAEEIANQDDTLLMIGGAYDFGVIKPRLTYAQTDKGATTPKSIILAATVPVDTNLVKLGYANLDYDFGNLKANKFSLGYEHVLSKRTAIYTDVTSGKVKGQQTVTGLDVGVRHAF